MRYLNGEEFNPAKSHIRCIAPAIAAALISGAGSIIGTGINAGVSWKNRQNDLELLQYQNRYNSPLEQMKRGIEAGINPNALAQGIAGSPGYGNMAAADASNVSNALPTDLGSQLGNSVNNALSAALTKANIENVQADTRGKEIENDYEDATFDARVQQALDSGAITAAEAEKARLYAEKYPEILDMTIEQMKETLRRTGKEIDKIEKDIEVSDVQIRKLEQDIKTSKSVSARNYAEAALVKEKQRNQELRNRNLELSGQEDGWQAEYRAIEKEKGSDAADKWLESTMEITNKVIENSSAASAQGSQNVVDETPSGQLKKYYQEKINGVIEKYDRIISDKEKVFGKGSRQVRGIERQKQSEINYWTRKMRRVEKGVSAGGSAFGFGANFGS